MRPQDTEAFAKAGAGQEDEEEDEPGPLAWEEEKELLPEDL